MKILGNIQLGNGDKKSYLIYDDISKRLKDKKLQKVWIITGVIKDEGFALLEDSFNIAKENGVSINFNIGIDRKTISNTTVEKMMNLSEKMYVFNNNHEEDFNAKIYIFEYKKKVEILLPTNNLTANGITNNISNTTTITFDIPKDEDEYNEFMFSIKDFIYPDPSMFKLLNQDLLEQLTIKREIAVAKTKDSKLPSISDYLKITSKENEISEEQYEQRVKEKIKNIVKDFDVTFDEETFEIKTIDEVPEEKETKKKVKKEEKKIEETVEEKPKEKTTRKTKIKEVEAIDLEEMMLNDTEIYDEE